MKPKVIHSYWTRPLETQRYGADRMKQTRGNVWIYALSLAYLLREGFEVELHTDSLGDRLLGFLPYKSVHKTLDMIPEWIHPRFWAAGKIWAMESAGAGTVHVDGDAFIKDSKLLEISNDADLIVSHLEEHNVQWLWDCEVKNTSDDFADFCENMGLHKGSPYMYNAGLTGWMNQSMLDEYVMCYKRFVQGASTRYWDLLTERQYATPDLFAEQMQLYEVAKRNGAKVVTLIDGDATWDSIGFQHLITKAKYEGYCVNKVKETLGRFFPEIYKLTNKIWRNI